MTSLRICIGEEKGRRSTVWWFTTSGADIYFGSRVMKKSSKISLHKSGDAQWSEMSEWFGKNRPGRPNQERHLEKWKRGLPTDTDAKLMFRIVLLAQELDFGDSREDLSDVIWIPAPSVGFNRSINLYHSKGSFDYAPRDRNDFVAALSVEPSESVVFLSEHYATPEFDIQEVNLARTTLDEMVQNEGLVIKANYRGLAYFVDDFDDRGMMEFRPRVAT